MTTFKVGDRVNLTEEEYAERWNGSNIIKVPVEGSRLYKVLAKNGAEGLLYADEMKLCVTSSDSELTELRAFKAAALAAGYVEAVVMSVDLVEARRIALSVSKQTGKNAEKFLSGGNDRGYGVKCARAAIQRGRELERERK